ncbi:MAG: hypothetical protein KDB80_08815 [Planctomycetes bacterium]|nr:hypothetical protein [Planctomycetota bacterium]
MSERRPSHPDRRARTLAQRVHASGEFAPPGAGSADARVDLELLSAATTHALESRGTPAARERLAGLDSADLRAGTVQDGCARGFAVALEEAASLCEPPPSDPEPAFEATDRIVGRDLRRRREFVLKSGGSRVRFARKSGITLIDRSDDTAQPDCIRFEDRTDVGDLDGFAPADQERPRLFHPGFLRPAELVETKAATRLTLHGSLGRRAMSFPCELVFDARRDEEVVRMTVRIENRHDDHRLRIRFFRSGHLVWHRGTPAWETVFTNGTTFTAATMVRANGRLRVDDEVIAVPGAQCHGWIEHRFLLGSGAPPESLEPNAWLRGADPTN